MSSDSQKPSTGRGPRAARRADTRPLIQFEQISKRFGDVLAVDRLSLEIHEGEFFALLGPSGCGKTTLLRMLAGFESPSEGRLVLDGKDISAVPPHRRPVNMMFQSYALFPHLTVAGNIGFGLRQEGLGRDEIAARVADILALVRLTGFGARKPEQLSGGQRQRVALARALVKRPRVLLLDEPMAALDKKLREETQFELMELQRRLGTTFVIVTHDQDEAMVVADRIGVMNEGRLAQVATPAEIYERPNSRWVADFIGDVNLLEARLVGFEAGGALIDCMRSRLRVAHAPDAKPGDTVWVALRPEKVALARSTPEGADNVMSGTIFDIGFLGDMSIYKIGLDDGTIMKAAAANIARRVEQPFAIDEKVWLSWTADCAVVLTA